MHYANEYEQKPIYVNIESWKGSFW